MNDSTPAPEAGARLDFLYDAFQSAQKTADESPTPEHKQQLDDAQDALFLDIENYAERVVSKLYNKNAWKLTVGLQQNNKDVVQTACLKAWAHLSAGRFNNESQFSTWLFTVVKNALTDEIRRRARTSESWFNPHWEHGSPVEIDDQVFAKAPWIVGGLPKEHIDLSSLSPEDRCLVRLKFQGWTAKQIAPLFGGSSRKVENEYARILKLLRDNLNPSKHGINEVLD